MACSCFCYVLFVGVLLLIVGCCVLFVVRLFFVLYFVIAVWLLLAIA